MSLDLREVLELLDDDRELLEHLFVEGLLPPSDLFAPEEAETARLAHTLVRELDVNWPGVEIILRLRAEILDTRRQMAELVALVRARRQSTP